MFIALTSNNINIVCRLSVNFNNMLHVLRGFEDVAPIGSHKKAKQPLPSSVSRLMYVLNVSF